MMGHQTPFTLDTEKTTTTIRTEESLGRNIKGKFNFRHVFAVPVNHSRTDT